MIPDAPDDLLYATDVQATLMIAQAIHEQAFLHRVAAYAPLVALELQRAGVIFPPRKGNT